jgi:hypothetical protein
MDLLQAILQAGGGSAVQQMAAANGLSGDQVTSVLGQLVPALAGGISHQTQQEGGLDKLMGALSSGRHMQYVEDPSTLGSQQTVDDGNGILGHIFGSKDVSRQVASQAAASTGVGADIIKKLLPMVAAMAMGAMAKRAMGGGTSNAAAAGEGGGMGDLLGGALGSMMGGSGGGLGGALGGMLGQAMGGGQANLGGGGGGSILDMLGPLVGGAMGGGNNNNQGGNIAGDVIGMLSKMMR